ncbi:DUF2892 domain-containing protein [Bacillus sp. 165]|uniref:YgaP family membrane protein n=1 Tax=Bacillus sp. 165 TaxID=1529117 RepID=UPI001ADB2492|nr:DUF2892 domain-containing protein [Bacillus sp. 165]MBO9131265.1 DUF2892 domain-containing protein [Bacillus sp. 165]
MKQNIGIINALIRITLGLTIVGLGTSKLVRKPWCSSAKFAIFLGAMKVAEGILRFCPITEAMKLGKYMNAAKSVTKGMDFINLPDMNKTKKKDTTIQEAINAS